MAMCSAFGSRIESSRRSALGQTDTSLADVRESPLANKVTSWPSVSSSSVSQWMTRSVPPYSFGGMASVNGAICAMCTGETSIAETPTHDCPGLPDEHWPLSRQANYSALPALSPKRLFLWHIDKKTIFRLLREPLGPPMLFRTSLRT